MLPPQTMTLEEYDAFVAKNVANWVDPPLPQARDGIMRGNIGTPAPSGSDIDDLFTVMQDSKYALIDAVGKGRLFGVSELPIAVIKSETERSRSLFHAGYVGHPYRETYALFVPSPGAGAIISVITPDPAKLTGFRFTIGSTAILAGRKGVLFGGGGNAEVVTTETGKFELGGTWLARDAPGGNDTELCLNAILVVLGLLATDGVPVRRIGLSDKQNRDRKLMGRPVIPPHWEVDSAPYVTALAHRRTGRSQPQGGTHASPVMHLRRGHPHNLPNGRRIWIRDTIVNAKGEAGPGRSFYDVQRTLH